MSMQPQGRHQAAVTVQVVRSEAVARTSVPPQAVLVDAEADMFALVAAPLKAPAAAAGAGGPGDAAAAMEDDGDAVSPRTLQQVRHIVAVLPG